MKHVRLYVACFVEHVRLSPMNVTAAFLILCVRAAKTVLTTDFWIVLSVILFHAAMNVKISLVTNLENLAQNPLSMVSVTTLM